MKRVLIIILFLIMSSSIYANDYTPIQLLVEKSSGKIVASKPLEKVIWGTKESNDVHYLLVTIKNTNILNKVYTDYSTYFPKKSLSSTIESPYTYDVIITNKYIITNKQDIVDVGVENINISGSTNSTISTNLVKIITKKDLYRVDVAVASKDMKDYGQILSTNVFILYNGDSK